MAQTQDGSRGELPVNSADEIVRAQRVEELTWALLDEQINDDEFNLLDTLLLSDDNLRKNYVSCVQLHVDLMAHFAASATRPDSPILSIVAGDSTIGLPSPSVENA
jgi:hypothetical protein